MRRSSSRLFSAILRPAMRAAAAAPAAPPAPAPAAAAARRFAAATWKPRRLPLPARAAAAGGEGSSSSRRSSGRGAEDVVHLSSPRAPPEIWAVEGNISSGKTTLCKYLIERVDSHNLPGCSVLLEPMQQAFLKALYSDGPRYAFAFQLNMLQTRITNLLSSQMAAEGTFVLDRSVFGDSVFATRNFLDGNINRCELAIYEESRALRGYEKLMPGPARMVYLDASPEVCHRRMVGVRQNEAEADVPLGYLDGLDEVYVSAVLRQMALDPSLDVVVMDASNGQLVEGGGLQRIEQLLLGEGAVEKRRARWVRRSAVRCVAAGRGELEALGGVPTAAHVYRSADECEEPIIGDEPATAVFAWDSIAAPPVGAEAGAPPPLPTESLHARTPAVFRRRAMKHLERGDDVWLVAGDLAA